MTALLVLLLALPASASALTGAQLLTFGDYGEHTEISTQYEGQGIVFRDEDGFYPEIRWDSSSFTNPVLGGTFGFGSRISAQFVAPGTTTPATVENLAMDVGYIDDPGSTDLTVERTSGPSSFFADEYGFNHLALAANDITGFTVEDIDSEDRGWEIDNLEYTIPIPPPPPPPPPAPVAQPVCPKFLFYDSRGSGEAKGPISKPGSRFVLGFLQRMRALGDRGSIAQQQNPYDAVGVFGFNHDVINGLGAVLHSGEVGDYWKSVDEGEKRLTAFLKAQIASPCGSSKATKTVLLGYSQGAQVTGNVYERLYPHLSRAQQAQIGAVVLWGDPRYNPLDSGDRENRTLVGLLGPRLKFPDAQKVFSYCNTHDPICQEPLSPDVIAYYRGKEHSLYWTTDEAKNNGSAVASFLVKGG